MCLERSEISFLYLLQLFKTYFEIRVFLRTAISCFMANGESKILAACLSENSLLGVGPVLLSGPPHTLDVVLQRRSVVPASSCLLNVLFVCEQLVPKAR